MLRESVIADGKEKMVKKELTKPEKKAFWAGANLMLLGIMAVSVWACANIFRDPEVRVRMAGVKAGAGDLEGTIVGSTIRIADPSTMDRLIASSPSLVTTAVALAVLIYSAWMDWQNISGPDRPGIMSAKAASATSIVLMAAPVICQIGSAAYFNVQISFDWDGSTVLLLFLVMTHLFLRVHENRESWAQEHRRAETLDKQVKDVV